MANYFPPSELIINDDGSAFHLHLRPEQVADKIILVGDPGRVSLIASHFSSRECEVSNREFHTITGLTPSGKRITAISTGIGCGNIDIVMNELDALANIDFATRTSKPKHTSLELVRIGTCGGLQEDATLGTFICSAKSIGLDGLLNFYAARAGVCDTAMEQQFAAHMGWHDWRCQPHPYVAVEDEELSSRIAGTDMMRGITVTSPGFFGPQGRCLHAALADPEQNAKIETFEHSGMRIANYEMESAPLAGLAAILGHKAACVCMVVAARRQQEALVDYKGKINELIEKVLVRV